MLAEIITIGDEILIGQIADTNSAHISKELDKIGVSVYQITSVHDDRQHILKALSAAGERVDLVILTGGLGPTKDDVTKQTFCDFFGDTLVENPEVVRNVKHLFEKFHLNKPLPANIQQAMVPSRATVLMNHHGTAPGMWMERGLTVFVSLPGVPYEMKHLLQEAVLPRVIKRFKRPHIYHKTLLTYGMGESAVAEKIADFEDQLPKHIRLAYLPSLGRVRLRLSATGANEQTLKKSVDQYMNGLKEILSDIAVGYEDETSIAERIGRILTERNQTYSVAESCTGGRIASEITQYAGASTAFVGGIVPYHTQLKTRILGVPKALIEKHNVVSIAVARQMAAQCCHLFGTDYAIATTGIAGPTKGDGDKEIGTVCIAVAGPQGVKAEEFHFGNDRHRVIEKAANKALEMLLKEISKN